MKVTIDYNDKKIEDIIRNFYLTTLTPKGIVRENIAVSIKHIYFYSGITRSDISEVELKMVYRQIINLAYSVIEAIVISVAYQIQMKCRNCFNCGYRDLSMFLDEPEVNQRNAFYNADKFLRKIKILDMPREDLEFYSEFRHLRNEIHLINSSPILTNPKYSDDFCKESIEFLKRFFIYLKENYLKFKTNICFEQN